MIDDGNKITLFMTPERVRQLDGHVFDDGIKIVKSNGTLFSYYYHGALLLDQAGVNGWWATDNLADWLRKNSDSLVEQAIVEK